MSNERNRMEGDDIAAGDRRDGSAASDPPVLLYDGLCGFCDRTVQFVLARDVDGSMRFATLQGQFAAAVLHERPGIAGLDSLVLVEREGDDAPTVRVRSDAAIAIGLYLGGVWSLAARVGRVVPRFVRDAAYDLFARHRYRLFGRHETCPLPSPAVRHRFID
jgi:predicted DCC family thiol-disulfide oxidoreductase YuxK